MSIQLTTKNLKLILQTPAQSLAWVETLSAEVRAQISLDWLARLRASSMPDPWTTGFSVVLLESGTEVGSCGYKGPPGADGSVEIAYGVDPEYQNRGYATEVAQALVDYAFTVDGISVVRAHTLSEVNASTRVLTKCGFEKLGEVIDPEDGLVWRWERRG